MRIPQACTEDFVNMRPLLLEASCGQKNWNGGGSSQGWQGRLDLGWQVNGFLGSWQLHKVCLHLYAALYENEKVICLCAHLQSHCPH